MSQTSFFVSIDELIGGYVHAQVVYVAAKLGLADLFHGVKTGKTGSEAAFGKSFFAYLNEHPDVFEHFNTHMSQRMRCDRRERTYI